MNQKDEDLLSELLLVWEEQGQKLSAEELCKDHPHLVQELAQRIHALKSTAWLDKPLGDDEFELEVHRTTLEPRTLIGRYRLEKLVAEGGFAYVWLGFDEELQRPVAVKVPKPNRAFSIDSFMAEARRVARLKHPGIVQVYDTGRDGDSCFIVSEFVEGGSLADQLRKNRPTQEQAIRWIIQIAEALEYAHLHGVVHRDIKPANILIDHHHCALLADFGIAQSASKSTEHALSLGTLSYVSPEQLVGKPTDPRSDVYSLGVVLHEVLTGTIPYSSREPNVLRKEIASGAQAVSSSELSDELKRICKKALNRDPQDRYKSAAHFGADLGRYLDKKPSSMWRWIALVLALLGGGLAFANWYKGDQVALESQRSNVNSVSIKDAFVEVQGAEKITSIVFTPDGNMLTSEVENIVRLWDTMTWKPKQEFTGLIDWARCVDISKDGKWIVACSGGHLVDGVFTPGNHNEVVVWDTITAQEERRFNVSSLPISTVAISTDGKEILTGSDDKLVKLWDRETGQEKLRMRGHSLMVRKVKFIPNSKQAVSCSSDKTIRIWDLETGDEVKRLRGHTEGVESIACSPDGTMLASASKDNTVRIWDVRLGKVLHKLTDHENHVISVWFSTDGRLVLSGSLDHTARLWDALTGKCLKVYTDHLDNVSAVALSPSGNQVITGCGDGMIRVWNID
ncbi:MAG: protein kinase domain-containing protein [Pirellula sp.]